MKAQNVKNTVIVPVGAKGGFYPKRLPAGGSREDVQKEGIASYQTFIRGLLDVTDNIVERQDRVRRRASCAATATTRISSSPPTRAPRRSPTSPTPSPSSTASGSATRSPRAARPATTTRAWASPRAAPGNASSATSASSGVDIQSQDFTCAGIGDMSGDVFGNGMLLSKHIRLVAAFDHRHIFLDPNPDAAASFRERERLFKLPRSSWDDYYAQADLARRRRVPAQREVDSAVARGADAARARRGRGHARRGDARHPAHAGRPAVERRHRHLREGGRRIARRGRRPRQRRDARQRRGAARARSSAKAATSAARSAAASSTRVGGRRPAAASTPTSSTTPRA